MQFAKVVTTCLFVAALNFSMFAQGVAINETDASADPSAILDVASSDKGVLIPRMTQGARDGITAPSNGLLIYQTDNNAGFYFFNGTVWVSMLNNQPIVLTTAERLALVSVNGTIALDSDEGVYYYYTTGGSEQSAGWVSLKAEASSGSATTDYAFYSPGEASVQIKFFQSGALKHTASPTTNYGTNNELQPYMASKDLDVVNITVSHIGYYNQNVAPTIGNMNVSVIKYNLNNTQAPVTVGTIPVTLGGAPGAWTFNNHSESISVPVSGIQLDAGDLFGVYVQGDSNPDHVYGIRNCTIVLSTEER